MKKILVEVNETYLEGCRQQLEKMWGVTVSNSSLVGHFLFLHYRCGIKDCQMCGVRIPKQPDVAAKKSEPSESFGLRKPLRTLEEAWKESK